MNSVFIVLFSIIFIAEGFAAYKAPKETLDDGTPVVVTNLKNKIERSRSIVLDAEKNKRKYLKDIYDVSEKIRKMSKKKGALQSDLFYVKSNIKNMARSVVDLEKEISSSQKIIRKQMKVFYKIAGKKAITTMFSFENIYELKSKMKFLSLVAKKDFKLLNDYVETVEKLKVNKEKLNAQVKKLLLNKTRLRAAEEGLINEQRKKISLINAVNVKKKDFLTRVKKLRKNKSEKQLSLLNELMPRKYFFEQKGELNQPTKGVISKKFGLENIFDSTIKLSHKGISYFPTNHQIVKSVFSGKVVYAGKLKGYNQVVIIDHNDHYYSVYSNINTILVKLNDLVVTGQKIAEIKSEGLYFEIRHYAQVENPENWFNKNKNKNKKLEKLELSSLKAKEVL